MVNDSCCTQKADLCGIPHETVLGPLLLGFFISDLEKQMQNILFKFVDDTKSGGAASTLQGRASFRAMDLESVEERVNRKPHEIKQGKMLNSALLVG